MTDSDKYTPSLRFPEFLNDGEWRVILLKDAINKVTPPKKLPSSEYKTDGQFPVIDQSTNIIAGYSDDYSALINTQNEDYIVFGDHTCTLKLVNHPFIQGADGIKIFRSKLDDLYTQYLYYYLLAHPILPKEYKRHFADLAEKIILFPKNLKEQIRIAECFSSIDKQIAATKRKLEQLKEHKRGLMQRIFPAKGKTVPELRFTEFRNDGEWEIKKLRDIATFSKGKGISKTDVTANGTTPCIRYGELYTTYKETITDVSSYTDLPVTDLFLSKANDVIIPSSGETKEDIATASCIIKDGIAIGGDINVIRTSNNGIFLSYYLTYVKKNDIARIAQGVSIIHLYNEQLRDLVVELPNSIKEQQRIADCLQSVDNVIKSYEDKITALELHKKGLMQQLFPKL